MTDDDRDLTAHEPPDDPDDEIEDEDLPDDLPLPGEPIEKDKPELDIGPIEDHDEDDPDEQEELITEPREV